MYSIYVEVMLNVCIKTAVFTKCIYGKMCTFQLYKFINI